MTWQTLDEELMLFFCSLVEPKDPGLCSEGAKPNLQSYLTLMWLSSKLIFLFLVWRRTLTLGWGPATYGGGVNGLWQGYDKLSGRFSLSMEYPAKLAINT